MDPSDNDVEGVDEALMAQMGFSSFGAASPPSKRRRYNPNADASLPSKSSATGANSTALGTGSNTDEIALDDDDDNEDKKEDESGQQASEQVRPASLPQRPAPAAAPRQGQHSVPHERRDTWYIGYYDSLSNVNPWERIEKARGLTTRGTWASLEKANAATTADAPA
ncbi:hypothetical protein NXS19_010555 [Fusarium pseudograminearum]|uniref:Uncharacterized protein n=1 Tax=Fusarium pseudograminearum (strain CS3096) TaxID=1028729 RepID=K3V9A7_FUSPC|nr:hypothetical protein FPSE_09804 [Fusarium pseudograminearum CS3096]EKJ69959.1 hypothetical protein FPSE_09804 [Fusarium pseudograminearum CS3096]KAF0644929.1 hypothetical protein FPSE5266_09804 [Fusarium pseudograminearum]UZP42739.1 hypothetical protein NXS19_010555 [Fusarium pseudograminearum]